jgi:hypothetical protein
MRIFAAIGVSLLPILATGGCATGMSLKQQYDLKWEDLNKRLQACRDAHMTKGELIMQVGTPTAKEVVEDGEVWVYEITDRGVTTTQTSYDHEYFLGTSTNKATSTTSTDEYNAKITLHFNKWNRLDQTFARGQNGALFSPKDPFLSLQAPVR